VGRLDSGDLQFRIASAHVDLAHLRYVQALRPGLSGALQLTASGAATVRAGEPGILAREVNLNLDGKAIALQGKKFGDISLTAKTSAGQVSFALDSSLAGASVQGRGKAQLSGDYPAQAQLTFHNVTWKGLEPLLGSAAGFQDFDAATDGQITVNGPALRTNALTGGLQLSRFQVTASATGPRKQTVTVENQGPVVVALDRGTARIESLHLVGPQTDVQAHGTVSFANQTMEVSVNAHTDLSLVGRFRRDVVSSGQLTADATVRGAFAKPLINGTLQLHDASVNVVDVAAGLANANGTVAFNGTNASFQNLTGEVGGGKVTLSGFVSYSDIVRLGLRVNGANVRLRLQPGVSAVADAELRLSGRTDASSLSGTVTIDQVSYAPQSDFGAILSRAAPVVQAPATPSPLLDNMKLDIQVRTSSATALQASGAQNLQADANLHIQGRASQPGVTGRITISQGQLVFFNSRYTVNSGSISFFNPIRIDPVLDLSLQTQAAGVDVTLQVTGPIDNMKLSYTSNPPLQFQEIVGLLAGGQMPTSDPTLLANQPPQPPQTFEQMGESALLDQALADPVSSRLQRVFGVTQFKIDPTFSGSSGLPQAQFTLQQQVTKSLTLTYSSDLEQPDAQTVSGNLMLSPQWSAIAARDPYGNFSIRLLYKKQFH
jgi:translocation and assembly module TamB